MVWQIIQSILVYGWMFLALAFLFLIWRHGAQHTQQLEQAQIKAALESSKAAHEAAEAACILACKVKIIEEDHR